MAGLKLNLPLILSICSGDLFKAKCVNNGFYVMFLVKHIFNQAVDLIEYIDFTPINMYPKMGIVDCRANMKATFI